MHYYHLILITVLLWSVPEVGSAQPPTEAQTRQWNEVTQACLESVQKDLMALSKSEPLLSGINQATIHGWPIYSGEGQVNENTLSCGKNYRIIRDTALHPSTEAEKKDPRFVRKARPDYVIDEGGIIMSVGFSVRSVDYGVTKVCPALPGTAGLASKQGIVPYYNVEVGKGGEQAREKIIAVLQKNLNALYAQQGTTP